MKKITLALTPTLSPLGALASSRRVKGKPTRMWALPVCLIPLCACLGTGCVGLGGVAKVVEAAGTKDKRVKTEFSGWNANWKYESEPVQWRAPSTNTAPQETWTVVPETTLRVQKNQ